MFFSLQIETSLLKPHLICYLACWWIFGILMIPQNKKKCQFLNKSYEDSILKHSFALFSLFTKVLQRLPVIVSTNVTRKN